MKTERRNKMIINCTQHTATPEQIAQGVVDLPVEDREMVCGWLTIDELPTAEDLRVRADMIASHLETLPGVHPGQRVMIGGAPYLMGHLERALRAVGLVPVYAFSRRESVETQLPDGSVTKSNVFRHIGFVEV
jgi:hypothetical protein